MVYDKQIAWLISTVGCIIAQTTAKINGFIWWTIAYQVCCVLGVASIVGFNAHHRWSMAVSLMSLVWVLELVPSNRLGF